jgi:hypothetical protein
MKGFLRREGKNSATRFVHIMAHGEDKAGIGTATLDLTFEQLDLVEHAKIFEGLTGKIIIFSCCEVGADRRVMETIKEASGAKAVIAYRLEVDDWYTDICEALLYDRLITTTIPPHVVVNLVGRTLDDLGIRAKQGTKKPVLVCV